MVEDIDYFMYVEDMILYDIVEDIILSGYCVRVQLIHECEWLA